MSCSINISVMAALFLTFFACLAIAAHARTISSENYWHKKISMSIDYGRPVPSIPSPKLSPSEGQLKTGSPCVARNPFSSSSSRSFLATENCYGKAKLSPPPSPASSKSPTQSENIVSPCVAGNLCNSSFIAMETDYGRKKPSTPPAPTSSKSPTQSENIVSPCVVANQCSRSFIAMETDYGGEKPLTPPSPTSSKSPTQSEIDSPCVGAGNPCSSYISMVTDQDYERATRSPPPRPRRRRSRIII